MVPHKDFYNLSSHTGKSFDEVFNRTLASGSTFSYSVDELGSTQALTNSTGAFTTQYTYDPYGQTTLTGTTSGSFSYDAANRRSQKTIAGQTTGYVFDGINLVQELTGSAPPHKACPSRKGQRSNRALAHASFGNDRPVDHEDSYARSGTEFVVLVPALVAAPTI